MNALALILAVDGGISAMLVMTAVSVAVSVASGYLMAKKPKAPLVDERPSTIATRGTFLPYVIGRRRIGPIFSWVGRLNRDTHNFGTANLAAWQYSLPFVFAISNVIKASQKSAQKWWAASGMHVLALGPVYALWSIRLGGQSVFSGPITSVTHPSGSLIQCAAGYFYIFWGESNQPINTNLGAGDSVGISSRWPFFCYVVWDQINLGSVTTWPQLDYEIETRIQDSLLPAGVTLPSSTSYMPNTLTLSGVLFSTIHSFSDGIAGSANFTLLDDQAFYFEDNGTFTSTGNGIPDGDYPIYTSTYNPVTGFTTVYINQSISGSTNAGSVEPYFSNDNDGINGAHIIAQLLFCSFPYGMGLDPTYWDITSLDALGALMVAENVVQSVSIQDGKELQNVLAELIQDMGVLIAWDVQQGKFKFVSVRAVGSPVAIPDDAVCPALPEIEALMLERPADKLIYVFADREHNYRDMTVSIDSDGQALFLDVQRAQKIAIPTTTVFTTAALIAERRSLEELSGGSKIDLVTNRSTRTLMPGTAFTAPGIIPVLRVAEIEVQPDSREVKLSCVTDFYGCPESEFVNQTGAGLAPNLAVKPDLFDAIEVPAYLLPNGQSSTGSVVVGVARVRKDTGVNTATLFISPDNVQYWASGQAQQVATGGPLISGINATDPLEQATGPTFTLVGPDIAVAQDLTSNAAGWRQGLQVVVIDQEICFCKKVTLVSGTTYRLDGFIRARYDTVRATHGAGADVFIFPQGTLDIVQDNGLAPGAAFYFKDQPANGSEILPLAYVPAQSVTLYGKGVRPMPMANLRANRGVNSWAPGADITLAWNYRSASTPKTGCGMQGAGVPVGSSSPQGSFIVTITDLSANVKRSFNTTSASFVYTNVQLVADFVTEPTGFIVNIYNQSGTYSSPTLSITVNRH